MVYTDKAQNLYIDLQPGTQILDGEKALQYVRYRADGLGDVALADPLTGTYRGRAERQLNFVRALAAKVLQPAMLVRALIVPQLMEAVHTNMPSTKPCGLRDREPGRYRAHGNRRVAGKRRRSAGHRIGFPTRRVSGRPSTALLGRHNMVNVVVLNGNGCPASPHAVPASCVRKISMSAGSATRTAIPMPKRWSFPLPEKWRRLGTSLPCSADG